MTISFKVKVNKTTNLFEVSVPFGQSRGKIYVTPERALIVADRYARKGRHEEAAFLLEVADLAISQNTTKDNTQKVTLG